jgi:hypothetical protein
MQNETASLSRRRFFQIATPFACTLVQACNCQQTGTTDVGRSTVSPEQKSSEQSTPGTEPYIDVVVRPEITPTKQPSSNTCWAAVWTMMLSWKEGKPLTIADAVRRLGDEWVRHFDKDEGLEAQTFTEEGFLKASGFQAKPPANYISSAYVDLLASHGPLWINSGDGILNHATMLAGAQTRRDGRINFRFADPKDGAFVMKSDEQFFHDFEREAVFIVNRKLNWDFRFQIFYWDRESHN